MTQADLIRLLFAKGDEGFSWKYCFNEQCPLANECARQLSVVYKNADKTDGYAVFPGAYQNGKCEHFMQLHLVKMAYGLEKMLDETEKEGCESVQKQYDFLFRKPNFVLSLQTGADSYHSKTATIHLAVV